MKKLLIASLLCLTYQAAPIYAASEQILSQKLVTESALKNYPKILSAYEMVNSAEGSLLASKGFFDVRLKQNYLDKSRGFYDGKVHDTLLEKELGFMGAKVYGGYRKSFGNFADYEGASVTNSGGEFRAGAKVSLLRNSGIDENRLGVILAGLSLQESRIQLDRMKMEIERDATKAYWKWVLFGKIYHIYEELYQLSLNRQNQLEQRLKRGDVAQIIVHENKKNILRRKSALAKARQDFDNSAIYLSLFWRNDRGLPVIPKKHQLPEMEFTLQEVSEERAKSDLEIALSNRPELSVLRIRKEEELNQLKYAKNLFKPELDVDFGASKDSGNGPQSRSQSKNYFNLNFSVPLQQREARGKAASIESKLSAINYEQQITEESIASEIQQITIRIKNIIEMHDNLVEEVKLAELLEASEREKFTHGASNFFLVNIREQDTAAARASLFEMSEKYQEALADYKLAIFATEQFAPIAQNKN